MNLISSICKDFPGIRSNKGLNLSLLFTLFSGLFLFLGFLANPAFAQSVPTNDTGMFIEVNASTYQPYVGEMIRVEYDVYVDASRGTVYYDVTEPEFQNWYTAEGYAPQNIIVTVDNRSYTKEPFAVYFVSTFSTGTQQLPTIQAQVPYIENKPWISHTPTEIKVVPLPEPAPKGFLMGNIGQFQIEVSEELPQIKVGEEVRLDIHIHSNAAAPYIQLPPPRPVEGFESPELTRTRMFSDIKNNQYISEIDYVLSMKALKEGKYTLPPIEMVTFDPALHQYRTVSAQIPQIEVLPGKNLPVPKYTIPIQSLDQLSLRQVKLSPNPQSNTPWKLLACIPISGILVFGIFLLAYFQKKEKSEKLSKFIHWIMFAGIAASIIAASILIAVFAKPVEDTPQIDQTQFEQMLVNAQINYESDPAQSLETYREIEKVLHQNSINWGQPDLTFNMGLTACHMGNYPLALGYFEQLSLYENSDLLQEIILNLKQAIIYQNSSGQKQYSIPEPPQAYQKWIGLQNKTRPNQRLICTTLSSLLILCITACIYASRRKHQIMFKVTSAFIGILLYFTASSLLSLWGQSMTKDAQWGMVIDKSEKVPDLAVGQIVPIHLNGNPVKLIGDSQNAQWVESDCIFPLIAR